MELSNKQLEELLKPQKKEKNSITPQISIDDKEENPILEEDKIEIFATYKRKPYKAIYYSQYKIIYNGLLYTSPSAACTAIIKTSCNGWIFWKFKDKNGIEHLLDELRRKKINNISVLRKKILL